MFPVLFGYLRSLTNSVLQWLETESQDLFSVSDWFLLARKNSKPSHSQSGSYVIGMEFFGSSLRRSQEEMIELAKIDVC